MQRINTKITINHKYEYLLIESPPMNKHFCLAVKAWENCVHICYELCQDLSKNREPSEIDLVDMDVCGDWNMHFNRYYGTFWRPSFRYIILWKQELEEAKEDSHLQLCQHLGFELLASTSMRQWNYCGFKQK